MRAHRRAPSAYIRRRRSAGPAASIQANKNAARCAPGGATMLMNQPDRRLGRPDDREDLGLVEEVTGDLADVLEGDGVDAVDHLVETEQLAVDDLGLAE